MRVLDLFSGIGGFSLGLERAGMTTAAFCEIDPKARLVLQKHWPKVPVYENVETLAADRLAADGITVDVICGGFPCQDISLAGKGAGLAGERSGLWFQFHRLIQEIRPSWAIIENVSALRSRGLEQILGGLAEIGYDAEWHCIPASAVGAPHRRDRVWVVAHASRELPHGRGSSTEQTGRGEPTDGSAEMADANSEGLEKRTLFSRNKSEARCASERETFILGSGWTPEPDVGRVADGVPKRVDRLKQLGNAVVPQIPEMIGRAIMATRT
jgi:DNA (cytosine-5)-methyltransferase 1